jgi:putative transposase
MDAYCIGDFLPLHQSVTEYYKKRRRNNRCLEKFYDAKIIDTRDNSVKSGKELSCNRTNRRESRNSKKSFRKYRGTVVKHGSRAIRKQRYFIQAGDMVSFKEYTVPCHGTMSGGKSILLLSAKESPTGKYYISILVEYENQILTIIPKNFLGLDFAMHGLYVASDEDDADYPNFLRKAEKRLAKAQRKLSKRQKESHNRYKQRLRVAALHEKIANQRRDFLHKKARYLADRYDAIGIEDISVKSMAKRKKGGKFSFGKSVADNGWNMFTTMLEYKLAWQGKKLIKMDKWYPSSQLCHVCGYQNHETKDLSVREWDCPKCGSHHNRDKNAAINIREEARRISA